MHAVRIHQFGDESVLRYEEFPEPEPGPGEVRVAVRAASINHGDLASGVGMAAIQIAKHCGAKVITTASSAAKLEFANRLGADAAINYTERDFVEETWRLTGGTGVDVVLESVGGETFEESLDVLRMN